MRLQLIVPLLILFSIPLLNAQEPHTLTNADIINMTKSGIGEQIIVLTIQKSTAKFDTSPDGLIQLKSAGVTDAVLNAMLNTSPAKAATPDAPQDCSQALDKMLATIGTPEALSSVHAIKYVSKNVSSSTVYSLERITIYPGGVHAVVQPSSGVASTVVVTPEFNYMNSGKMTSAVPPSTLEDIEAGLKLDPVYIAQHRGQYSCVAGGTEKIGTADTLKLIIKGEAVAGQFNADSASGRLVRTTYKSGSGQVSTDFYDWRQMGAIYFAYGRHIVNSKGTIDVTVSEYLVNPTVDPALFQPPGGQVTAALTLKVLQSESVPYTVQTNGGISTACNINGTTNTTMTSSTYGNTTYGTATSAPNLQMNCRSTDTTIRWTHVLNAMFVEASDGNAYIIACDRAWAWSKCKPLRAGDTFLAKRSDKGFVVQSVNAKSKEQEATYSILQSKSLRN